MPPSRLAAAWPRVGRWDKRPHMRTAGCGRHPMVLRLQRAASAHMGPTCRLLACLLYTSPSPRD
eukprot:13968647-Alexandrium_andersonii.AAC.1